MRSVEIRINGSRKLLSINENEKGFLLNYNLNHRRYNIFISDNCPKKFIYDNLEKLSSIVLWIEENLIDIHKQAIDENYNKILQSCVSEQIFDVLAEFEKSDFVEHVIEKYGSEIACEMLDDTKRYYKIARERAFDKFVTKEDLFDNTYSRNCRIYMDEENVNLISVYFEEKIKSTKKVFLNKSRFKVDYATKFIVS